MVVFPATISPPLFPWLFSVSASANHWGSTRVNHFSAAVSQASLELPLQALGPSAYTAGEAAILASQGSPPLGPLAQAAIGEAALWLLRALRACGPNCFVRVRKVLTTSYFHFLWVVFHLLLVSQRPYYWHCVSFLWHRRHRPHCAHLGFARLGDSIKIDAFCF